MIDTEAASLEDCYNRLGKEDDALRLYRVKVHSMKSSALLIGAVPVGGMAKILEDAARKEEGDTIRRVTPVFLEEWKSYKQRLKGLIKEEPKEELKDISLLLPCLQTLARAMDDMDIDTADAQMKQLRQYQYPADLQDKIEELDIAVNNLDSAQAGMLVEKIMTIINYEGGIE